MNRAVTIQVWPLLLILLVLSAQQVPASYTPKEYHVAHIEGYYGHYFRIGQNRTLVKTWDRYENISSSRVENLPLVVFYEGDPPTEAFVLSTCHIALLSNSTCSLRLSYLVTRDPVYWSVNPSENFTLCPGEGVNVSTRPHRQIYQRMYSELDVLGSLTNKSGIIWGWIGLWVLTPSPPPGWVDKLWNEHPWYAIIGAVGIIVVAVFAGRFCLEHRVRKNPKAKARREERRTKEAEAKLREFQTRRRP